MKTIILLLLSLMILTSCEKQEPREITSKDPTEKLVVIRVAIRYHIPKDMYFAPTPNDKDSVLYTKMNGEEIYIKGDKIYNDSIYTNDSVVYIKGTYFYTANPYPVTTNLLILYIFNKKATDSEILGFDYTNMVSNISTDLIMKLRTKKLYVSFLE